jgi:hypothetical protein
MNGIQSSLKDDESRRPGRRRHEGTAHPAAGHSTFRSAFEEAMQVTGIGIAPREIRVRWNPGSRSYTWTVRY